jgi:hypothetical protein
MVGDKIRVREAVAQHAGHVACGKYPVAQLRTADLNRLEELWEKSCHFA